MSKRGLLLKRIVITEAVLLAVSLLFFGLYFMGPVSLKTDVHGPPADSVAIPADSPRRITIAFGGDVMQHLAQIGAAQRDSVYDFTETFRHLKPFFDSIDLVMVNLETTISANGRYSGYPLFSAPAELAAALRESEVDIVMLANNHICDKGANGLRHTIETVEKAGLKYTGAYADSAQYEANNPLYVDVKGVKLAILNYTYGTNGMPIPEGMIVNMIDTVRIAADMEGIDSAKADHTIVFFHWGGEYSRRPDSRQKELAAWCHVHGVEFVIGSHPHVLQPAEVLTDDSAGITAYSLGNLVSNQRKRHTDGGMILKVDITRRDSASTEIDAQYMLTWVHVPSRGGKRRFEILPSPVADTLLLSDHEALSGYRLFLSDSRHLLGTEPLLREIKAPE